MMLRPVASAVMATLTAPVIAQAPMYEIANGSDGFGGIVVDAGDINGDGVRDIAAGMPFTDAPALNAGSVVVYDGATGAPVWQTDGPAVSQAQFGTAVCGLGDVDGDGFGDLAVGAPGDRNLAGAATGSATVYSGKWLVTGAGVPILLREYGSTTGDRFGSAVAPLGLDNSNQSVVVGAPEAGDGAVFVYDVTLASLTYSTAHGGPSARFGAGVGPVGDMDSDGNADFMVGAPDDLFGFGSIRVLSGVDGSQIYDIAGTASGVGFGLNMSSGGDLDGDGVVDIAVGLPTSSLGGPNSGQVVLYSGLNGQPIRNTVASSSLIGSLGSQLGSAVSIAGDVNGDGFADILAGAPEANTARGTAHLYSGRDLTEMAAISSGTSPGQRVGRSCLLQSIDMVTGSDIYVGRTGVVAAYAGEPYFTYSYCPAADNSTGGSALLAWDGSLSISAADFELVASGCPSGVTGLFFLGPQQIEAGFGNGLRCVGGATKRVQPAASVDSSGVARRLLNWNAPYAAGLSAGSGVNFQYWFRDPMGGGAEFNLSSALNVVFRP